MGVVCPSLAISNACKHHRKKETSVKRNEASGYTPFPSLSCPTYSPSSHGWRRYTQPPGHGTTTANCPNVPSYPDGCTRPSLRRASTTGAVSPPRPLVRRIVSQSQERLRNEIIK